MTKNELFTPLQGMYCENTLNYQRFTTKEVKIGHIPLGAHHPIRIQSMTTTDTMNTIATVEQTIRMVEAGCEYVRITAPSVNEAQNLAEIKKELKARGYEVPLIADIHFTPNAAETAARIVEKVRINPGNYADKKKFENHQYTQDSYDAELERIYKKFKPLVAICKEYGTAMRIGTNHGSLSDRIMSHYGDTPQGMVESAMEFIRMCESLSYYNLVISMKSSNPQVMVQAYRILVQKMHAEGMQYPLHLGVTEAGDGEDGRIKSAVGIGTLLEDGLGDTVRVSLTEDPELEAPVCKDLLKRYPLQTEIVPPNSTEKINLNYSPFAYTRRKSIEVKNIGGHKVPVVIADLSHLTTAITPTNLSAIGYDYSVNLDKWNIQDAAADYVYLKNQTLDFEIPGTLQIIVDAEHWQTLAQTHSYFPLFEIETFLSSEHHHPTLNFVSAKATQITEIKKLSTYKNVVLCIASEAKNAMQEVRNTFNRLSNESFENPIVFTCSSSWNHQDEHLIHFATEAGALLLDGFGDGLFLRLNPENYNTLLAQNLQKLQTPEQFLNATAFGILQATRTRISKTEYISCPSCGRTLFDLQQTTQYIRSKTSHLKGIKIGIMGCIVNGPGEMADADYGYVGTGVDKITLYRGKEVVKKNVDTQFALDALIDLIKEDGNWIEKA